MNISWELIIGGFGLFIFGIKFMGDGLKSFAGDKLRDYIDKYTSKPIMGVAIGAIITCLIQSSSATTSISIGLVRSGLMTLEQAAGIIMGANIGTTFTAFLIGLSFEKYALYFVCIGACLYCFTSRKNTRYIGEIIFGFGLLFYGLNIMGDTLSGLANLPEFETVAISMSEHPSLSIIAGALMTAVIQSSSAVIGVVQKLYETGGISLIASIAFVFGSNIGTTITGVFAALGGSVAAKRTATFHTMFNVVGTIIAFMLLDPITNFVQAVSTQFNLAPMMQVAFAHILFNVAATILFFPFLKHLCKLVRKIIPGKELERIEVKIEELNPSLVHALPSSAIEVSSQAILQLRTVVEENTMATQKYLNSAKYSMEESDVIRQAETLINSIDKKITDYIMLISQEELNDQDLIDQNLNLSVIKNLERIGDLSVNLLEFYEMIFDAREVLTEHATNDINEMYQLFYTMLEQAMTIYRTKDIELFKELTINEDKLDALEFAARQGHFERMSNQLCTTAIASSVYCDILGNLERMGDHCNNIAKTALDN